MKNRIGNEIALRAMIIVVLLLSSSISTITLLGSSIPSTYAHNSKDTFESREIEFLGKSEFKNIKPIDEEDLEEEDKDFERFSTEMPKKFIHPFEEIKDKDSFIKQKNESTFEADLDKATKASSDAMKAKGFDNGNIFPGFDNVPRNRLREIQFDGPTQAMCGGGGPPDPTIAVGKDHIVVMDNLCGAIYNKAGRQLRGPGQSMSGPFPLGPFFHTGTGFISDPFVIYDQPSGRFFATILDKTRGGIVLAISTSNGPLNSWLDFFIDFRVKDDPNGAFLDQPFHATSSDKFVVSGNMLGAGPKFPEVRTAAFDKACLLTIFPGDCKPFFTRQGRGLYALRPVATSGTSEEINLVSSNIDGHPDEIRLDTWTGPANNMAKRSVFVPIIRPIGRAFAAQPNTFIALELNTQIQSAYETPNHKFIWLTFNDACVITIPGTVRNTVTLRTCIRLVEIDKSTQKPTQDFNIEDPNNHIFYGALTVDSEGALYIVFGASGQIFPSLFTARQLAGAPSETVEIRLLRTGANFIYNPSVDNSLISRYGDYFGAVPETNGKGAWLYGEYVPTNPSNLNDWGTFVGKVR